MLGLLVRPSGFGHFRRRVPFVVINPLGTFGAFLAAVERRSLHVDVEAFVVEKMAAIHFLDVEVGRSVDDHVGGIFREAGKY